MTTELSGLYIQDTNSSTKTNIRSRGRHRIYGQKKASKNPIEPDKEDSNARNGVAPLLLSYDLKKLVVELGRITYKSSEFRSICLKA